MFVPPGYPSRSACTPSDAATIALLGGRPSEDVTYTHDQVRALRALYEYSAEDATTPEGRLAAAGADRNLFRLARRDGARVLGLLARYVPAGTDPVRFVVGLLADAGCDVEAFDAEDDEDAEDAEDEAEAD